MRVVFLCGVLIVGGAVGFAVARGHDYAKAMAVGLAGFALGALSLAGLDLDQPAQAAASTLGLLGTIAGSIGLGTAAGGIGLGFVLGVLLVEWDA